MAADDGLGISPSTAEYTDRLIKGSGGEKKQREQREPAARQRDQEDEQTIDSGSRLHLVIRLEVTIEVEPPADGRPGESLAPTANISVLSVSAEGTPTGGILAAPPHVQCTAGCTTSHSGPDPGGAPSSPPPDPILIPLSPDTSHEAQTPSPSAPEPHIYVSVERTAAPAPEEKQGQGPGDDDVDSCFDAPFDPDAFCAAVGEYFAVVAGTFDDGVTHATLDLDMNLDLDLDMVYTVPAPSASASASASTSESYARGP